MIPLPSRPETAASSRGPGLLPFPPRRPHAFPRPRDRAGRPGDFRPAPGPPPPAAFAVG